MIGATARQATTMAYCRKFGKRWAQRRAETTPRVGHRRACATNEAHQNACSDVASSDHKVAMTGRSGTLAPITPVPFSFRSSQSQASSQMGKDQIAPNVSGKQIKAMASREALAREWGSRETRLAIIKHVRRV